jgi:cytochrome c-type protein NapB
MALLASVYLAGLASLAGLAACSADSGGVPVPGYEGATKSSAGERAERRLFDGAPPVVPHGELGISCIECHDREGVAVADLGFAPPSPHGASPRSAPGLSDVANCRQCHVDGSGSIEPFVANAFAGLRQDLRRGERLNPLAPPVIPHAVFLRGNCLACHAGPAAREEIRTSHPERTNCRQCHVEQRIQTAFAP